MSKKIFIGIFLSCLSLIMLCSCSSLDNYKASADTNLDSYIQDKNQNDYIAEDWVIISGFISTGKNEIDAAKNKADIDDILEETKLSIDAVLPKGGDADNEFSATIDTSRIDEGIIKLVVKTKNIGEQISYMGSSTKIGASAEIFLTQNNNTYYWEFEGIDVNDDYGEVIIANNEIITNVYTFNKNGEQGEVPAGTYSLKLSYKGTEKIYENIIKYD